MSLEINYTFGNYPITSSSTSSTSSSSSSDLYYYSFMEQMEQYSNQYGSFMEQYLGQFTMDYKIILEKRPIFHSIGFKPSKKNKFNKNDAVEINSPFYIKGFLR